MAITYIDNFPVKFNEEAQDCPYDDRPYCQLVQRSDITTVVIQGDQCTGANDWNPLNMSSYPHFNALWFTSGRGDWTWKADSENNYAVHYPGQNAAIVHRTSLVGYYKITFTIGYGDVSINDSTRLTSLTGTLSVNMLDANGVNLNVITYDSIGEKTVYIDAVNSSLGGISFVPSTDFDGSISQVSAVQIQDYYSLDVYTWSEVNGISFYEFKRSFNYVNRYKDFFVFEIDWDLYNLADGCYRIAIQSGCELGQYNSNMSFNNGDTTNWTIPGDWTITGNKLKHTSGGGTGTAYVTSPYLFISGSYVLRHRFRVTGWGGSGYLTVGFGNGTATVKKVNEDVQWTPTRIYGNGWYDIRSLNTLGSAYPGNYKIQFTPSDPSLECSIDDVSITDLVLSDFSTLDFSNCFTLKNSHPCTKLLSWTNSSDAFGIPYSGLGALHRLRVESMFGNSSYKEEQSNHVDSDGVKQITYAKSEKIKPLLISEQPEYIHDAIRLAKIHDEFKVDGVEYVADEGDYEPEWQQTPILSMAKSRLSLRKKTDISINKKC